jgi:hypothetical protein
VTTVETLAGPRPAGAPAAFRRWCWTAGAATAAAGALHLAAAVDHLGTNDLVVAFFGATALGQLAAAAGLAVVAGTRERPPVALLSALLAVTVGLVCLYLVAHSTDLLAGLTAPAAPGAGAHEHGIGTTGPVALGTEPTAAGIEPPDALGTLTVAAELLAAVALTALLPLRGRRLAGNVVLALGGAAWLLWLTGVLG